MQNENKLGVMPIKKLIWNMSLPIIISMLVQALYNVVDSVFVSHVSESALTAVSLAFSLQNVMIAVGVGTGVGVNAMLSKSLGEKNQRRANATAENGIFLSLCSFVVFLVIGLTCMKPYFYAQTGDEAIARQGIQYLSVCCIFSLGLFTQTMGEKLLAATGRPYDTLEGVIGLDGKGKGTGTLMDYGIQYDEAPLKADFTPDYDLIAQKAPGAKVCHIQRSRGYLQRNAFDLDTIKKVADTARAANPEIIIFVDNCYGEFTQTQEPCQVGADLVVGSLIKNPGGGIAPTGGYIAGRKDLVELCAYRLNAPGLGKELGCTLETPRDMYLGFYYAPGVVCEAIKTAIYAQCMLELLGKNPVPRYCEDHNDIVTCFDAGTADALIGFCQGIQAASPVDSYAAPEPSPEPGYTDEVVMASGSFTQGSTIELSCDGPLREPYTCYLQGGLNFAASRAGVLLAIQKAYFKD
mgnify:CR=1 FL=1